MFCFENSLRTCIYLYISVHIFKIGRWKLAFLNNQKAKIKQAKPNHSIKGVLHLLPQKAQKLACFVLYLKIINISLKNNISWIL